MSHPAPQQRAGRAPKSFTQDVAERALIAVLSWLIHRRIAALIARFEAMFEAWRAGTLILPPVAPPAIRTAPRVANPDAPRRQRHRAPVSRPSHVHQAEPESAQPLAAHPSPPVPARPHGPFACRHDRSPASPPTSIPRRITHPPPDHFRRCAATCFRSP